MLRALYTHLITGFLREVILPKQDTCFNVELLLTFLQFPPKTSPIWNLLNIFTPLTWMLMFLAIGIVTMFFFATARIGVSYFGIRTYTEEIILSPFRQIHILEPLIAKLLQTMFLEFRY